MAIKGEDRASRPGDHIFDLGDTLGVVHWELSGWGARRRPHPIVF